LFVSFIELKWRPLNSGSYRTPLNSCTASIMATMFFDGGLRLNAVNRVEDEPSAGRENLAPAKKPAPGSPRGFRRANMLSIHASAPKDYLIAEVGLQCSGSIPVAEHCTGFKMSNPASINEGMNFETAPQVCLKVFHGVWA